MRQTQALSRLFNESGYSSKKAAPSPDGGKDENVFDIQQGVAIAILVRRTKRRDKSVVKRADLWGDRKSKYEWLTAHNATSTSWEDVTPSVAPWLFVKQDSKLLAEYEQGWSVADIFSPNGDPAPGIITTHDEFAISWSREEAIVKVERLLATSSELEARQLFTLCSQNQWSYARAKKELANGAWRQHAVRLLYRPFDIRWTIWDSNVSVHRRERVMSHLLERDNVGLIINRQVNGDFHHALVSSMIINDCTLSNKSKERSYILPLWIYPETDMFSSARTKRQANISAAFIVALTQATGFKGPPRPEDIFAYIYAVLYSPVYQQNYSEVLGRNFPRVPVPQSADAFERLAAIGRQLVELHLMRANIQAAVRFPKAGSNRIEKIEFKRDAEVPSHGRIFINSEQFFEGVYVDVWEYVIGCYQVANKWLKDRKDRLLSFDELKTYGQILSTLAETIRLQTEIDNVISPALSRQ